MHNKRASSRQPRFYSFASFLVSSISSFFLCVCVLLDRTRRVVAERSKKKREALRRKKKKKSDTDITGRGVETVPDLNQYAETGGGDT